jgi:hypothetical protein
MIVEALSPYIGDPDVIPDHQLRKVFFASDLMMTFATGCLNRAFPGSILLLAGPPPLRNTVTGLIPWPSCWEDHVESLQLPSSTQSHWSSWSTVCFPPMGAAFCIPGMHPRLQWNRRLLLTMSRNRIVNSSIL